MNEQKRYKLAEARAIEFSVVCPFKGCLYSITKESMSKGDIIACPNCRKEFKIKRVL